MSRSALKIFVLCVLLVGVTSITGYVGNVSAASDKNKQAGNEAAVVAVGAVVASLVFDGNSDDAASQNEVQPASTPEQLEKLLGEKALLSLGALTDCKHSVAFNYARQASASSNSDYELAGLWLEALTEADRKNWFEAKAYFPKIRNKDRDIKSQSDYDTALSQASREIAATRQEYGPASSCQR